MRLNLYQRELIAIGGSKFRAQNSKKNCYSKVVLEKKLANIENHINKPTNIAGFQTKSGGE